MKFEKPEPFEAEKEKGIEQIDLRELSAGDRVKIETGDDPENISIYEMTILGREKGRPRVDAKKQYFYKGEARDKSRFTARWVAGGFDLPSYGGDEKFKGQKLSKEEKEFLNNLVKPGDHLYFETIKTPKENSTTVANMTMPIRKIMELVKKVEKTKEK